MEHNLPTYPLSQQPEMPPEILLVRLQGALQAAAGGGKVRELHSAGGNPCAHGSISLDPAQPRIFLVLEKLH